MNKVPVFQAIFAYPDGRGAMALSSHHYELLSFAHSFAVKMGCRVATIARRYDVCGKECGRLLYSRCDKCDVAEPIKTIEVRPGIPIPAILGVLK